MLEFKSQYIKTFTKCMKNSKSYNNMLNFNQAFFTC